MNNRIPLESIQPRHFGWSMTLLDARYPMRGELTHASDAASLPEIVTCLDAYKAFAAVPGDGR